MDRSRHSRRGLLRAGLASFGGLVLAGCDQISDTSVVQRLFDASEALTYKAQSLLLGSGAMAREYAEADISPSFRANGSTDPQDEAYLGLVADGFKDWQLRIDGLVDHPQSLSLAALRAMPSRTQITRHDCVEGWSCIGKWTGRAARPCARPCRGQGQRPVRGVPLRRHDGRRQLARRERHALLWLHRSHGGPTIPRPFWPTI